MRENVIREILKVVSQPGMISLAGGIPAPETFPIEELYRINETVLDRYGAAALQYDRTEGFTPFREALVGYLAPKRKSAPTPRTCWSSTGHRACWTRWARS